ncbi:MAG: arginase family protein, partial [Anaerolineaceae bacterium]|nr:arginase family protein [Anaerolineaceae bacterium]
MSNSDDNNRAYGAHLQPFSGITTFMRRPASRDFDAVDVAVVGVPFDSGTSFRSGARFGPRKIREMSLLIWGYHPVLDIAPAEKLKIIDYGDIEVIPVNIEATMKNITHETNIILENDITPITLGG